MQSLHDALSYAAPGFRAIRKGGEISLFQWQAANVRRLTALVSEDGKRRHGTEVLSCAMRPAAARPCQRSQLSPARPNPAHSRSTALVFAPKVIVTQWAAQIALHFEADVSRLRALLR